MEYGTLEITEPIAECATTSVDEIYVKKLRHSINAHKSTGYDNIPSKMVKMCANENVSSSDIVN